MALLEALYDGTIRSNGPCVSGSLAEAAVGPTAAAIELMTATTLRPPGLPCACSRTDPGCGNIARGTRMMRTICRPVAD